jgi:hypothetical protein
MKQHISKFLLFVYLEYIKEDWEDYHPFARNIIKPLWRIQSILIWIVSPLIIPSYIFKQSKLYSNIQKELLFQQTNTNEYTKLKTQDFLNKKYSGKLTGNGPKLK